MSDLVLSESIDCSMELSFACYWSLMRYLQGIVLYLFLFSLFLKLNIHLCSPMPVMHVQIVDEIVDRGNK